MDASRSAVRTTPHPPPHPSPEPTGQADAPPSAAKRSGPSTADFVLHELTSILETLAEDYEGVTTPIPGRQTRMLITRGMLIRSIAIYVELTPTGAVELSWLDIDR